MKTAKEIVLESYPQFDKTLKGKAVLLKTTKMMHEYARQVAEAVRSECYFKINTGSVRIKDIDIEQFIK